MDKQYYLLINKINYKFGSTLDVIVFVKKTEAKVYKEKLLKGLSRQLTVDEANYGIGNPSLYLIVNDNELVYTIDKVKLRNTKLTDKLSTIYNIKSKQFSPSYTKSNFKEINEFIDSIQMKVSQETNSTNKIKFPKPEITVLYDENWNPIGCTMVRNS